MDRLLVAGGTVLTMVGQQVLEEADVLIEHGQIASIGAPARGAAPGAQVIDARGCAVMPGLVNAHTHLFQTLFRGFVDGVPLPEWLRQITESAAPSGRRTATSPPGSARWNRCAAA